MCSSHSFSTLPSSPSLYNATFRHTRLTRFSFPTRNSNRAIRAVLNEGNVNSAPMSFYELLGISETCNLGEIKQAYKQLARKYHPDVSPLDRVEEYTERFIRVHNAYETLSDPGMRAMYDCDMARGIPFSFSTRKSDQKDGMMEGSREWRNRWQTQLLEMNMRRSAGKEEDEEYENMSWGARMRKQRNEA